MLQRLKKSVQEEKDQGFTLIELLVVIVIVGILAAIAIPIFLNQRQKAVDAGIESDLKAVATVQETIYTEDQAYATTEDQLEDAGFQLSKNNEIETIVADADGYCIIITNDNGSDDKAFKYDSNEGGLVSGATVSCEAPEPPE